MRTNVKKNQKKNELRKLKISKTNPGGQKMPNKTLKRILCKIKNYTNGDKEEK